MRWLLVLLPCYKTKNLATNSYQPGYCNIGRQETNARKRLGYVWAAAAVLSAFVMQYANFGSAGRLLIFAPVFISVLCFKQAKARFCIAFGFLGIFRFDGKGISKNEIPEYQQLDRRKAVKLTAVSALIAAMITLAYLVATTIDIHA